MPEVDLSGKRGLVVGAETAVGGALALALAGAGADVAVVAASDDAEAAFAVKRVARQVASLGRRSLAQAINGVNDMAVRVMVRQVAKELGGLDMLFFCADLGENTIPSFALACRYGAREMARSGGGSVVALVPGIDPAQAAANYAQPGVRVNCITGPLSEPSPGLLEKALYLASNASQGLSGQIFPPQAG